MKKIIIYLIFTFIAVNIFGWLEETAALEDFVYGEADSLEYDNWLSHVVEGVADEGYNFYAPYDRQTAGFGNFTTPNTTHLWFWNEIAVTLANGEYAEVDTLLNQSGMPFKLVEFNDTVSGDTYWMIRENINPVYVDDNGTPDWDEDDERGSFDYGWGLFIINPNAEYPVIITTPHITDDFHTAPYGVKAFRETGAYALLMNGTGREVLYDESHGYYSNSYSLCDPSRVEDLPFNRVYQAFCDHMRDTYGQREFSLQIHSYDWNRHQWYANTQISAGWGKSNPGIPIRDYSDFGWDIANIGDPIIHQANSIGVHPDVHLNDFFAFNCPEYPFTYTNEDTSFAINTSIDLPGYRYNKQMTYTCNGWSDDLTRDPFFHIEMDELPNCYPQTEANYYWFWGYDPISQKFDYDHLFDIAFEFYDPWIEQLGEVIPQMFDNDDGELPTDIDPLEIVSQNYDRVLLSWEKTSAYDYDSYQILYSEEPVGAGNYEIWDRTNDNQLGNAARTYTLVTGLDENSEYYFQARALDVNGNYSAISNEVSCYTAPARLRYENAVSADGEVHFSFNALYQSENAGFIIYRKAENEDEYILMDSYENNTNLIALNDIDNFTYNWTDYSVENWTEYSYIAASSDSMGNEYWHNYPSVVTPFDIYTIHFMHEDSLLTYDIEFGASHQASNGWETNYDIEQTETPNGDYVFAEFYEEDWNGHNSMIRQIDGYYDFDTQLNSWIFRVKSNQQNDNITISSIGNFERDGRKLYLIDQSSGITTDILNNDYVYENTSIGAWRYFTLYWGNMTPSVDFANPANHIYHAGETISMNWNLINSFVIENFDVYVETSTDFFQIAAGLPPFFNQAVWTVPDNLLLEEANVVVDLLMIDGDRHQFTSPYQFGTVPSTYTLAVPAGNYLVSNPFIGTNNIAEMLGSDANIYSYNDGIYETAVSFVYGLGYFLETQFGNVAMVEADIQGGNDQFDLQMGWNIVPNPHITRYLTQNLRFIAPDWEMTFAEAVQYELIDNAVYTFDDTWHKTDLIRENESFLIFVNEPSLQIKFIPYVDNYNTLELVENSTEVRLTASQMGLDKDEIIFALNPLATPNFDKYYDLPEPPAKPGDNSIRLYSEIDSTGSFSEFNLNADSEYDIINEIKDWEFTLNVQQLEETVFALAENNLPQDMFVKIIIEGIEHNLTLDGDFAFMPSENLTSGIIRFIPVWLNEDDNIIAPSCSITNYPNPFYADNSRADGVNIAFNIPQDGMASIVIYNIKGQKVKELTDQNYSAGSHILNWNLKNKYDHRVSSGVYFTRLNFADQQKFTKMVIIK